jgi:hypothetical protein
MAANTATYASREGAQASLRELKAGGAGKGAVEEEWAFFALCRRLHRTRGRAGGNLGSEDGSVNGALVGREDAADGKRARHVRRVALHARGWGESLGKSYLLKAHEGSRKAIVF